MNKVMEDKINQYLLLTKNTGVEELNKTICSMLLEYSENLTKMYFEIPFSSKIDCSQDVFYAYTIAQMVNSVLKKHLQCYYMVVYNEYKTKMILRNKDMESCYTLKIPYNQRNRYVDALFEINSLCDDNGSFTLFVNNVPAHCKAYVVIETMNNTKEIEDLIEKNSIDRVYHIGYDELLISSLTRQYSITTFDNKSEKSFFSQMFNTQFIFNHDDDLAKAGYDFTNCPKKKKLFISYTYADKEIVYDIKNRLKNIGVNLWIDEEDISCGDKILDKMLEGLKECDFSLHFISKSVINKNYVTFEISTMYNQIVTQNKKWFLIKLDNVNFDKVIPFLSMYKYYDFSVDNDIEKLVLAIKKFTESR